jgi:hypothetical protein
MKTTVASTARTMRVSVQMERARCALVGRLLHHDDVTDTGARAQQVEARIHLLQAMAM